MRQHKKTLHLRLRGGGGDGGVYPLTHAEQKWMTPSEMGTSGGGCHSNAQKDRATEGTLRLDRSTVCAATAKPLKAPIVVCDLGYLLNKEDVIELMLSKALPPHLSHIKSLKGLHEATLTRIRRTRRRRATRRAGPRRTRSRPSTVRSRRCRSMAATRLC